MKFLIIIMLMCSLVGCIPAGVQIAEGVLFVLDLSNQAYEGHSERTGSVCQESDPEYPNCQQERR